jgi:hypothetical protein
MSWLTIVAALIELVGPLVKKWLENRLRNDLDRARAAMGDPSGVAEADAEALLREVYRKIPWLQFTYWRWVGKLIKELPPAVAQGRQLSHNVRAAISAAAPTS